MDIGGPQSTALLRHRIAALETAFEAQLTYRLPTDLSAVATLLETLAASVPARGAVRVFIQQWPVERIGALWQDFRVAAVKLFRRLRALAEPDQASATFLAPAHAIVMAA